MIRRSTGTAAAALALAAASAAMAQMTGEHLAAATDPSMVLEFTQAARTPIQEYVPRGETVETWTRMITIQRLGYRPGLTPASFLATFAASWERVCPDAVAGTIAPSTIAGHAAADLRIDCPRNPQTGKPETAFARTLLGDEGLHMVQVAFRNVPSHADVAWAQRVIGSTRLCPAASSDAHCQATEHPAVGAAL